VKHDAHARLAAPAEGGNRRARLSRPPSAGAPVALAAATGVLGALPSARVDAAASASFQIPNGTVDVAGGTSSSTNYVVTACVGSEIAGPSASASFRLESGCGAALQAIAPPLPPNPGSNTPGIPTLAINSVLLLAALIGALAAWQLRRRDRRPQ
jgi:hypothetical protein